jgi:hypothetical protein
VHWLVLWLVQQIALDHLDQWSTEGLVVPADWHHHHEHVVPLLWFVLNLMAVQMLRLHCLVQLGQQN